MSKKFRLLMVLVLVTGLLGGLMTASTVSADPVRGTRIQIPRIDRSDLFTTGAWNTKLQIQNTSTFTPTWAAVIYWPAYSGECPPNDPGTLTTWHRQQIPANGVWTLTPPTGAYSALVVSFLGYTEPTTKPTVATVPTGQALAVTVDRWGLDGSSFKLASSYVGISTPMEDDEVYVPYVMYDYNDLDTTISIQNSGEVCSSVWIYYKQEGNCESQVAQHITELAPGEAIRVGPGGDLAFPATITATPGGWLGSAYIAANVPLGVIVDQWSITTPPGDATMLTYRGRPYPESESAVRRHYADLLYREISGWSSSIQVQNLTRNSMPTFVTVDFMDQSGDEILFVGDWICRNGAATFYLPAIFDLGHNFPFGYVGAAEIQSSQQVDYPGEHHHDGEPIFVVVDIKKTKMYDPVLDVWRATDAGETQGGSYNAHPEDEKTWAWDWFMPFIAREGNEVSSKIAIRNNSNCNKITGKLWLWDETGGILPNGPVGVIDIPWLQPKHMKIIDLQNFGSGWLAPGFVGAATFSVGANIGGANWDWSPEHGVEQLCDVDNDGHVDNEAIMPSVVVMNYGWARELDIPPPLTDEGDLARIYEAIPLVGSAKPCTVDILGKVHNYDAGDDGSSEDDVRPLNGVTVTVSNTVAAAAVTTTTDSTGDYEVEDATAGTNSVTFRKWAGDAPVDVTGYYTGTQSIAPVCGEDEVLDCEMLCEVDIGSPVMASDVDIGAWTALGSATVNYSLDLPTGLCGYSGIYYGSTTSDPATGWFTMTVPLLDRTLTYTVSHSTPSVIETRRFQMNIMDAGVAGEDRATVGSVTIPPWPSVWYESIRPGFTVNTDPANVLPIGAAARADHQSFIDDDCPWQPYADEAKIITDTLVCAYGQVSGAVTVGGAAYPNQTVTAVRVADDVTVATATTDALGLYVLTLPTGVAPTWENVLGANGTSGNVFRIWVLNQFIQVTFNACGQGFAAQNFAF